MAELLGDRPIDQIAFLVPDLKDAVEAWSAMRGGEEDWLFYTYGPDSVTHLDLRGEPGGFSLRLALHGSAPQLEFIEPVNPPSIYHEWIAGHGHGFHHVGYFVPSLETVLVALAGVGVTPVMSGRGYGLDGDGGFAYFDFVENLGSVIEFIEIPKVRRPSEQLQR
jgi:catechol 2,3-dioxygenase-like lactoylglutathione lyase family enzyme